MLKKLFRLTGGDKIPNSCRIQQFMYKQNDQIYLSERLSLIYFAEDILKKGGKLKNIQVSIIARNRPKYCKNTFGLVLLAIYKYKIKLFIRFYIIYENLKICSTNQSTERTVES